MKNKIKFILPLLVVAIILTNPFKVLAEREKAEKTEKTEINGFINNFFDYRDKSKENNILTNQSKLYKNTLDIKDKEIGRIESSLFEQIDNKKLERYFKNYVKLENIVASISDIEEEILDIQTKKTVTYDNNNIYLNVERIKESIFTIQGTKFDEPSYESSKYTFVFDRKTNKLIDYIPTSTEEQVFLKSDMDKVIKEEAYKRIGDKQLIRKKEDIIHSNHNIETKAYRTYDFNRSNMVAYANKHAKSYNPNYPNFENMGGDCTNFVSQVLRAGNAPFDTSGSYRWYYYNMNNRAPAWSGAKQLYNYLINNTYIGPQGKKASTNEIIYNMRPGDPVFIDFGYNNSIDHAVVITSYNVGAPNLTRVAAHTNDRVNYPLANYKGRLHYIRLTGYGKI